MDKFKIYIFHYIFGNFSKKLFNFSIVVFLLKIISLKVFILYIVHYFQYVSLYFFNDLIDRKEDLKRKYILPEKLALNKRELKILGILHFVFPLVILLFYRPIYGIISSFIVLFGILRSFIRNRLSREITLWFLQTFQIMFIFYLFNKLNAFYYEFTLVVFYTTVYTLGYRLYKNLERRSNLVLDTTIIIILFLINLVKYKDFKHVFLALGIFLSFLYQVYILSIKKFKKKENFIEYMNKGSIYLYFASFTLIFLAFI